MGYFRKRIRSFKFALNGFKHLVKDEPNARIHLIAAIVAVTLGFYLELSRFEWLWISLAIALVLIIEIINTSIEQLGDAITLREDCNVKKAKDLGAAATLLAAIWAVVVAGIIFIPKLIN